MLSAELRIMASITLISIIIGYADSLLLRHLHEDPPSSLSLGSATDHTATGHGTATGSLQARSLGIARTISTPLGGVGVGFGFGAGFSKRGNAAITYGLGTSVNLAGFQLSQAQSAAYRVKRDVQGVVVVDDDDDSDVNGGNEANGKRDVNSDVD